VPLDQFHGAVMLDEQTRRQLSNGRLRPVGQAPDGKQQLVLLNFNSVFFRRGLAEMKESPDLSAELGQIGILTLGKVTVCIHYCIVARYN